MINWRMWLIGIIFLAVACGSAQPPPNYTLAAVANTTAVPPTPHAHKPHQPDWLVQ